METDCAIAKIVSSHLERFARYPGEASMTEILTSDMTIAPICLAPRRGAGKLEQTSAATPRVPNRSLRAIVHGTQCVTAGFTVSRDAEDCWQDELSEYFFFSLLFLHLSVTLRLVIQRVFLFLPGPQPPRSRPYPKQLNRQNGAR